MKMRKILIIIPVIAMLMSFFTVISAQEAMIWNSEPDSSSQDTAKHNDTKNIDVFKDFEDTSEEYIIDLVNEDAIKGVIVNGNYFYILTKDQRKFKIKIIDQLYQYFTLNGITPKTDTLIQSAARKNTNQYTILLIFVAFCGFMIFISKRNSNRGDGNGLASPVGASGNGIEKSEIPDVRFDDVQGIDELKSDIYRLVDCLKNGDKYRRLGARTPKGVILYGPPGTGKTMIAKAIAGEAGVAFFNVAGSDFVEKYVGVGAQRVRELYKQARKSAPCIVFIDEVDAVAGKRNGESNKEADQTLNALLSELDGFNSLENKIITICATNRLDILDSAFKRAGRFDLKLAVNLPNRLGRYNILKIHSRNKILDKSIDLNVLAGKTVGFSGAELEALLNEGALLAASRNKESIDMDDIDDAYFKIVMQGNKLKREEITKINRITAYHEAGHTLATKILTNDSVSSVTIIQSSSGAGGVTFRTPQETGLQSRRYLKRLIMVMYAGRAAEEIYTNDVDEITTGASQDIRQATSIIKDYLAAFGMGSMGMIDICQLEPDYSDIVIEASEMAKALYQDTINLLRLNIDKLEALAQELLKKETLTESEIDEIIGTKSIN